MEVTVDSRTDDFEAVETFLTDKSTAFRRIRKRATLYIYGDTEEYVTVISADEEVYGNFILLKNKKTKEEYIPTGSDRIADYKMGEKLGLSGGEKISVYDDDFKRYQYSVLGICLCLERRTCISWRLSFLFFFWIFKERTGKVAPRVLCIWMKKE